MFGPVLVSDLVRSARQGRTVWLRAGYGILLLLVLLVAMRPPPGEKLGPATAARLAERFFGVFVLIQVGATVLLTPALVAGAVAEDRERRILDFLLVSDLS